MTREAFFVQITFNANHLQQFKCHSFLPPFLSLFFPQGTDAFFAGDEIYVVLTASKLVPDGDDWAPVGAKIRCAIEVED